MHSRAVKWISVVVLSLSSTALWGHHSAAMFDFEHERSYSGTVREFQWTNPHCYIQLVVRNERGKDEEWSLEMGAPMYLFNQGWRRSTVKPGDRLDVVIAPLRNGSKGGLLLKAVSADGSALGKTVEVRP